MNKGTLRYNTTLILIVFAVGILLAQPASADADTGWYKIYCNIDGASVYIDDQFKGTISNGLLSVPWTLGSTPYSTVIVIKDGYITATQSLPSPPATAGASVSTYITLQQEQTATNGQFTIKSNPNGAKVILNEVYKGETPITIALEPGTYTLVLTKDGYEPKTETIIISKGDVLEEKYTLKRGEQFASLTVSSIPAGAGVYIDNVYKGLSPVTLTDLKSGEHLVTVKMSGYEDWNKEVLLTANTLSTYEAKLEKYDPDNIGQVYVSSNPGNADVYIDDEFYLQTQTAYTESVITLPPETYSVRVSKNGYYDYTTSVTISKGSSSTVTAELSKSPSSLSNGAAVYINSYPQGASVFIDDAYKGITPITLTDLTAGKHTVKLTMSGYGDVSQSFTAITGAVSTIELDMNLAVKTTPKSSGFCAILALGAIFTALFAALRSQKKETDSE